MSSPCILAIVYLIRQLVGRCHLFWSLAKGVVFMSTYEEFMIIIAVATLIISILNMKNNKK